MLGHRLVCSVLAVAGLIGGIGSAQARTEIRREPVDRREACFQQIYVPAKVQYNSRGTLLRRERRDWEVRPGTADGPGAEAATIYARIRRPAIYIETRRVIEKDHFMLRRIDCPAL